MSQAEEWHTSRPPTFHCQHSGIPHSSVCVQENSEVWWSSILCATWGQDVVPSWPQVANSIELDFIEKLGPSRGSSCCSRDQDKVPHCVLRTFFFFFWKLGQKPRGPRRVRMWIPIWRRQKSLAYPKKIRMTPHTTTCENTSPVPNRLVWMWPGQTGKAERVRWGPVWATNRFLASDTFL